MTLSEPSLIPKVLAKSLILDVEELSWIDVVPFLSNSTNVDKVLIFTSGKMMDVETQQGRSSKGVRREELNSLNKLVGTLMGKPSLDTSIV